MQTLPVKSNALQWRGAKLVTRVWVCNSSGMKLFHVTGEQALVLLQQQTVTALVDDHTPNKLWQVALTRTPGETHIPPTEPTVHTFKTGPSVIRIKNSRIVESAGTFEFRKFPNKDRWAYRLSITDNLKRS